MIFILLSILCSSINIWLFKLFAKFKVQTFQAIVLNYGVCVITGLAIFGSPYTLSESVEQPWFLWAAALALLFISGFYLIAITTQRVGVAPATVASKLSLIFPVTVAIFFYGDSAHIVKILGVLLAVSSVFLTSFPSLKSLRESRKHLILPGLVLLTSGIIELLLNHVRRGILPDAEYPLFTIFAFGIAGSIGLLVIITRLIQKKVTLEKKSFLAAIVLGIPNYFSIYFLLRALDYSGWESSVVFPVNNIGIVLLSIFGGIVFFRERLTKMNIWGVLIAILAIVLITFYS